MLQHVCVGGFECLATHWYYDEPQISIFVIVCVVADPKCEPKNHCEE